MKIVFFGTPEFAVPFLNHLEVDNRFEIEAAVTQPDKPVGRKKEITAPPVKQFAQKMGVPVLQPEKIKNNPDFIKLLKGLKADFFVVVAYGAILPNEILEIPKYDCINVHASLLPKYRGASPIQSALLNGDKETGVSFMSLNEELDTGDVYLLKKIEIEEKDTQETLSKKLADIGATLLPSVLRDIEDHVLTPLPQNEDMATYCTKISKEDAQVDPKKDSAQTIINKLRAFTPWPGIFMIYKGKRLKILEAEKYKTEEKIDPGTFKAEKETLLLGTENGILNIKKLQPEGKNPITAQDFINGFLS